MIIHICRWLFVYILQAVLYFVPVSKESVMFYSHNRKGLSCNPKYIMKGLIDAYPGRYKIYWVSDFTETVPANDNYKILRKRSLIYFITFCRCGYYIYNDCADEALIKKRNQVFVNTWHGGGALKKAGFDIYEANNEETIKKLQKWYLRSDYMIIPNEFLISHFRNAFRLKEHQMMLTGMPRSDVFYGDQRDIANRKIKGLYGINNDTKILLYAPTYRHETRCFLNEDQINNILWKLSVKTGEKWMCLLRLHQFEKIGIEYENNPDIINCTEYDDVQEIVCASDWLLSDYSSLLADFGEMLKPCIAYASDLDAYLKNERDFYKPFEEWPYLKAKTYEELICVIEKYNETTYVEGLKNFNETLGYLGNGCATEKVLKLLFED